MTIAPPAIPDWIKELRAEGWANIYEILDDPRRLTGVDSFCGDWGAETLILGKDCAPGRVFRERRAAGDADPYRHDPRLPTNRMIHHALASAGVSAALDGSTARTCGVFYANAYFLLRDDGRFSGALPNRGPAFAGSQRVLQFIIENLPKLRRIIAMGEDAHGALRSLFGFDGAWREHVAHRIAIPARHLSIHASAHPGSRGVRNRLPGATLDACKAALIDNWRAAFAAAPR